MCLEVTATGQASECHFIFTRGALHIVKKKTRIDQMIVLAKQKQAK